MRIWRTAYGRHWVFIGLLFAITGIYFTLVGFGQISTGLKVTVPAWVLGCVGLMFAMAGLLFGGAATRSMLVRAGGEARRHKFPNQPWMHDYPWHPGGISDQPGRRVLAGLLRALGFSLFVVPFNYLAFSEGLGTHPIQWLVGLFDLVVLFAVTSCAHQALRWLKFGRSQLAFSRFPFAPGEELDVSFSPVRSTQLTLTLRFVEEAFTRSGRSFAMSRAGRSVAFSAVAFWREVRQITLVPGAPSVPIRWQLPDKPEYVNQLEARPTVRYWELVVETNQWGLNFRTTFLLPVYPKTEITADAKINSPLPALVYSRRYAIRVAILASASALIAGGAIFTPAKIFLGNAIPELVASAPKVWASRQSIKTLNVPIWAGSGIKANGDIVWAITDAGLRSFEAGKPHSGRIHPVPFPLKALHADSGQSWVGGKQGQIFNLRTRKAYTLDPPRGLKINGQRASTPQNVEAIVPFRGNIFALAWALYRLEPNEQKFRQISELQKVGATVADGENALYAAAWGEIWRYDGNWQRWFIHNSGLGLVQALAIGTNGKLYAGARQRVIEISPDAQAQRQWRIDSEVTCLVTNGDRLFVGTTRSGLWTRPLWGDSGWTQFTPLWGLPKGQITDLAFDAAGNLWLAIDIENGVGGIAFIPAVLLTDGNDSPAQ